MVILVIIKDNNDMIKIINHNGKDKNYNYL